MGVWHHLAWKDNSVTPSNTPSVSGSAVPARQQHALRQLCSSACYYMNSPFRRAFKNEFLKRCGELELGRFLSDPLKSFPNRSHGDGCQKVSRNKPTSGRRTCPSRLSRPCAEVWPRNSTCSSDTSSPAGGARPNLRQASAPQTGYKTNTRLKLEEASSSTTTIGSQREEDIQNKARSYHGFKKTPSIPLPVLP